MSKAQILTAILLLYLLYACAEKTAQPRIDDFLRPPPFHNQPNGAPSSQDSSYFSRFTNWIFSSDDQSPSATQSHPYPNPSTSLSHPHPKQSSSSSHPYPNPNAIPSRYGVPTQQENDCNPCNNEPWVPVVSSYGAKKVIGFVSQQELRNIGRPNTGYGAPNNNYRPTNQNVPKPSHFTPASQAQSYGPPKQNYDLPSNVRPPNYNAGGPQNLGSSLKYGPPSQPNIQSLFTPSHSSNHRPKYGVPILPTPLNPDKYPQPSSNYESPLTNLRPPPPTHTTPDQHQAPSAFMGPPPLIPNQYRTPDVPPNTQYSSPTTQNFEKQLPPVQQVNYGSPTQNYNSRPNNQYSPSTQSNFSPNTYLHPPSVPAQEFITSPESNNHLLAKRPVVDSYGPAPAGPILRPGQVTSEEYLPPPHELPITTEHENTQNLHQNINYNPIPFPNMSPTFILPIHNARPFRGRQNSLDNGATATDNIPAHTGDRVQGGNVQIIKSVSVADYLSTIEYPPDVVQSPIFDVTVNENNDHDIPSLHDLRLSQNPIVVDNDEHHQEASVNHASVAVHNNSLIHLHSFPANHQPSFKNEFTENNPSATETVVKGDASLQTLLDGDNSLAVLNQLLNQNDKNPPKPFSVSEASKQNDNAGKQINENAQETNSALFTAPTMDYTNWSPSLGPLSTAMIPPPNTQNSWISAQKFAPFTTKKPKQIQIIVPYTSNNNQAILQGRKVPQTPAPTNAPYSPPLSIFTKIPAQEESQWLKYTDNNYQGTKNNAPVSNIQDFFKNSPNTNNENTRNLPFDILKLQQNIDVWTEQEYNKMKTSEGGVTSSRFAYSKKIPDEYFTTPSLNVVRNVMTESTPRLFSDYVASGTFQHYIETKPQNLTSHNVDLLESNLIGLADGISTQRPLAALNNSESSGKPNTTPATWDKIQVSISPLTNERVYVVTPQQWETDATTPLSAWSYVPKKEIQEINKQLADNAQYIFNSPRFAVRPEPVQQNITSELDMNNKIHSVYSDWPELINNLAVTTTETPRQSVTTHPLLGRMDILADTTVNPLNRIVQTYTGHSKVVTAVTAASAAKKKTVIEDKKFTTRETSDAA